MPGTGYYLSSRLISGLRAVVRQVKRTRFCLFSVAMLNLPLMPLLREHAHVASVAPRQISEHP